MSKIVDWGTIAGLVAISVCEMAKGETTHALLSFVLGGVIARIAYIERKPKDSKSGQAGEGGGNG